MEQSVMEKLVKMEDDLFYQLRHLKTFRDSSGAKDNVWSYRWPDGGEIEVYEKYGYNKVLFKLGHDPQLAEYICSLHNMSRKLLKEVESKYAN
jgi:hypothetical protein